MKLYYAPQTRAGRVRWMLEELDVPYELVKLDFEKRENRQPAYLEIHPLGAVPALADGDVKIFESAAICMYLADKFPEKQLAPPVGSPERGLYYQWIIYTPATIEPAMMSVLNLVWEQEEGKAIDENALAENRKQLRNVLRVVETRLQGKKFIVGDRFSTADLLMASVLNWANMMKQLDDFPALQSYAKEHTSRPASKRAREA